MAGPWENYAPTGPWSQFQNPNAVVDVAKDVGRAGLGGLITGAMAIPDLSSAVQSGMDKLLDSILGPVSPEQQALRNQTRITSKDAKGAAERALGTTLDASAATTPIGKAIAPYVQSAAEFTPMSVMTGGGAIVGGAIPGVASEAAGQLTKGTPYEPFARMGGALAGAVGGPMAARAISPNPMSAERQAAVQTLRNEGVTDITAGQQTGSRGLRYFEAEMGGRRGARTVQNQSEQFTSAALARAGINARRATPDVIDDGFTRIGQQFDGLAARNTMVADQQFSQDLIGSVADYFSIVPPTRRAPIVEGIVHDLTNSLRATGGTISGDAYQALRSRLDKHARTAMRSDPQLSEALRGLRNALDDAMERSITPADQGAWREARRQYRNMLVIEKAATGAGENAALGLISPSHLRNAVVAQNRRAFARGGGDFADLSRAGEAILKPLPDSGTPGRLAAQGLSSLVGGSTGAIIGGQAGGPEGGIMGAIAGAAAPRLAGRAAMTAPGRAYLANQAAVRNDPALARILRALMLSNQNTLPARQ